jgi:acetyl esterase/lipase
LAHARSGMRDVTYCTVGNAELKLDIYYPKSRTGVTQLVIFIHGGGLSKGDKRGGEGMLDAPSLLDAGFTVASLNYRLAPEYKFPTMIQDVKCAVRFLRAHANEYKIDANKIGVWGTSAGGLLVNLLGTTDSRAGFDVGEYLDQSSRVQAVVDMFGPGDLTVDFSRAFI